MNTLRFVRVDQFEVDQTGVLGRWQCGDGVGSLFIIQCSSGTWEIHRDKKLIYSDYEYSDIIRYFKGRKQEIILLERQTPDTKQINNNPITSPKSQFSPIDTPPQILERALQQISGVQDVAKFIMVSYEFGRNLDMEYVARQVILPNDGKRRLFNGVALIETDLEIDFIIIGNQAAYLSGAITSPLPISLINTVSPSIPRPRRRKLQFD